MRKQSAFLAVGCLILGLTAMQASPQADKSQRPSPPAKATCAVADGSTITVDYSSPRAKGRKIFGGLVPYGEVWRTGANEATTFVTTGDQMVGSTHVPAGSYTLFTIPNKDKWTLIINKKTGEWGIPYKYQSDELARLDMQVSATPSPVENFTIALDKAGTGCTLRIEWESTRATVAISKM